LGITARLRTASVLGGATVLRLRSLDSPEQADQRDQQRRSQAHPHHCSSSWALRPLASMPSYLRAARSAAETLIQTRVWLETALTRSTAPGHNPSSTQVRSSGVGSLT